MKPNLITAEEIQVNHLNFAGSADNLSVVSDSASDFSIILLKLTIFLSFIYNKVCLFRILH